MEKKGSNYPIKSANVALGIFIYFVLYSFVFPAFFSKLTLMHDPYAKVIPITYQLAIYLITLIPIAYIVLPLLKQEREFDVKKAVLSVFYAIAIMMAFNLFFSVILLLLQGPKISANQEVLNILRSYNPFLHFFLVVLVGPFLEEFVFRGLLFRYFDYKYNFWIGTIVSSFLFGFVHVMDSFLLGNFTDFIYLFLYGGLGTMFAFIYKANNSIYACIMLHMTYNLLAFL